MKKYLLLIGALLGMVPYGLFALDVSPRTSFDGSSSPTFERRVFSSCTDLQNTLSGLILPTSSYPPVWGGVVRGTDVVAAPATANMGLERGTSSISSKVNVPYSQTNTQVMGIDEPDMVKNDGKYLYLYNEGEHAVFILDAGTLKKVSSIRVPQNMYGVNLFLAKNRLVVVANRSDGYNARWAYWYNPQVKTLISTYTLTDISRPKLERTIQLDGGLQDSRLMDDGQLIIITQTSYWYPPIYRMDGAGMSIAKNSNSSNFLPKLWSRAIIGGKSTIQKNGAVSDCNGVEYILPTGDFHENTFTPSLTTVLRVNVFTPTAEPTTTVILGTSPQVHLSRNSLYLVSEFSSTTGGSSCPLGALCKMASSNITKSETLVHRFALDQGKTAYVYTKSIAGSPLSQYAMDENDQGEFRIVTQKYAWTDPQNKSSTELSIIAKDGNKIGGLSNIAPGENFQSARFIGDRLYLVTFQQIDPLFVIDLANSYAPRILGELKIPGYSTYLHPYDTSRLIGIGYATQTDQWGGTQNGGIKVDLYNVSDVAHPKQEATLTIGDRGSSSDVLQNPRAFTYYKEKNLLLLPAYITKSAGDPNDTYRAQSAFQGLLGLSIMPGKILEQFRVTHISPQLDQEKAWKTECAQYKSTENTCRILIDGSTYCGGGGIWIPPYCYAGSTVEQYAAAHIWDHQGDFVTRALYIGDAFYSIAESGVRAWNFADPSSPRALRDFKSSRTPIPGLPIPMMIQ